jgi:hypothetical protein
MAVPFMALHHVGEKGKKALVVMPVLENPLSAVASRSDMVDPVRDSQAWSSGHRARGYGAAKAESSGEGCLGIENGASFDTSWGQTPGHVSLIRLLAERFASPYGFG